MVTTAAASQGSTGNPSISAEAQHVVNSLEAHLAAIYAAARNGNPQLVDDAKQFGRDALTALEKFGATLQGKLSEDGDLKPAADPSTVAQANTAKVAGDVKPDMLVTPTADTDKAKAGSTVTAKDVPAETPIAAKSPVSGGAPTDYGVSTPRASVPRYDDTHGAHEAAASQTPPVPAAPPASHL